jgi:hypothetical protein
MFSMEKPYDPSIFGGLNAIGMAYSLFREREAALGDLGDVICRHGLYDVIGVPLLHRHFELQPHEHLVRQHHGGSFTSRPCAESTPGDLIPCLWKVGGSPRPGEWGYYPLEYARTTGPGAEYKIYYDQLFSNRVFLTEMAETILSLGVAELYGIAIIPLGFEGRGADEVLLERQDVARRVNTSQRARTSDFGSRINLPSLWAFRPEGQP